MSNERDEREPNQSDLERAHALAEALDGKKEPSAPEERELAELATSLRAANAPSDLSDREHEAILSRALSKTNGASTKKAGGGGGRVIRVSFGAAGALALAAAIFLLVTRPKPQADGDGEVAQIVRSRSTAPLFSQPFKPGDASARIDRIAMARERDFRENRFTSRRTR